MQLSTKKIVHLDNGACTRGENLSRLSLLHVHGDERWPMEVTSNTYFRGVHFHHLPQSLSRSWLVAITLNVFLSQSQYIGAVGRSCDNQCILCFCLLFFGNSHSVLHIRKLSPDQQGNVTFPEPDAGGTDSEAFVKLPPGTFGHESWYFSELSSTCNLFAGLKVGIEIVYSFAHTPGTCLYLNPCLCNGIWSANILP